MKKMSACIFFLCLYCCYQWQRGTAAAVAFFLDFHAHAEKKKARKCQFTSTDKESLVISLYGFGNESDVFIFFLGSLFSGIQVMLISICWQDRLVSQGTRFAHRLFFLFQVFLFILLCICWIQNLISKYSVPYISNFLFFSGNLST